MVLLDQIWAINIHNRDEVVFILRQHLFCLVVVSNHSSLKKRHQWEQSHLNWDRLSRMGCASDKDGWCSRSLRGKHLGNFLLGREARDRAKYAIWVERLVFLDLNEISTKILSPWLSLSYFIWFRGWSIRNSSSVQSDKLDISAFRSFSNRRNSENIFEVSLQRFNDFLNVTQQQMVESIFPGEDFIELLLREVISILRQNFPYREGCGIFSFLLGIRLVMLRRSVVLNCLSDLRSERICLVLAALCLIQ